MHIVAGLIMLAHGVAHVVGFLGPWRIGGKVPYQTTILAGHVDVGDVGAKAIGVLWLLTAVAFGVVALEAVLRARWWPQSAVAVALFSVALCIVGWPEARIGVAINIAIVLAIVIGQLGGWAFVKG